LLNGIQMVASRKTLRSPRPDERFVKTPTVLAWRSRRWPVRSASRRFISGPSAVAVYLVYGSVNEELPAGLATGDLLTRPARVGEPVDAGLGLIDS